jgi:hypothetical protein
MLGRTSLSFALVSLIAIASASAWGQSVISAHSGVIHLAEGQVTVDGNDVRQKFGEFGDVKTGQTLATQDGRAEVLLTPGVFLRVNENSSFKMTSNKLDDTRIEILSGTAMVQVSELLEGNAITLTSHDVSIALEKKGLYRVDANQNRLRVYEGEARVTSATKNTTAKKGHEVQLDTELVAKSFDTKDTDAFYRWNERRDEYISEANVYAAKSARDSGFGYTGSGYGGYAMAYGAGMGSWMWNPWFGMFTYMPYNGMFYSPFGFGYYSPAQVGYLYMPGSPYYYGGGGGIARSGLVTRNGGTNTTNGLSSGASAVTRSGGTTGGIGVGGAHGGGPAIGGGASGGGHIGGGGGASLGGGGGHAGGGHR